MMHLIGVCVCAKCRALFFGFVSVPGKVMTLLANAVHLYEFLYNLELMQFLYDIKTFS